MSDDARMWWECSCGETWDEAGDTAGCGRAGAHTRDMKVQDPEGGHRIIGLLNEAGELLLTGWNLKGARTLFGLNGTTKASREAGARAEAVDKPKAAGRGQGGLRTGAAATSVASRRFHVLAGDISLSDAVTVMFAESARQRPDLYEDGVLSDPKIYDAELGEFVSFCVIRYCIEHASDLGLDRLMVDVQRMAGYRPAEEAAV